jgi:hypothetical protein
MGAVELDLTVGCKDEHPLLLQVAEQVMQQRQRSLVGPVNVVDEQDQPAHRGEGMQKARHVVEQA